MDKNNLVWIDLEMTGLDPNVDCILEIASIVTDLNLNFLAQGPELAIHQNAKTMENMNKWCIKYHGQSGLTQRVLESNVSLDQAEKETIEFLKQWVPKGASPLCGNSIGQDRRFLVRYMPALDDYFHYRNIDVSSIKELAKRWAPELSHANKKRNKHLALSDIQDSIAELQYYQKHFFKY